MAHELGASAGDRLVHADLHYGNVLAGNGMTDAAPWRLKPGAPPPSRRS
jgi:hypothetical protein